MSTAARALHATLDLLDRQLLDRDGIPCGNVDDVELTVSDDGTLYVTALLTGPGILSYRLRRKKLGLWLQSADRRLHGDGSDSRDRSRVPIERAYSIGPAIRVAMDRAEIAAHDLERWASEQIITKIPWGAMRLSDLLHCRVHDEDGHDLGRVSDIRITQDGPIVAGLQAAFRVDALVVGRGGLAERLGYIRGRVNGPWMLRSVFTRLETKAVVVAAGEVTSWDISTGVLRVKRRAGERSPGLSPPNEPGA